MWLWVLTSWLPVQFKNLSSFYLLPLCKDHCFESLCKLSESSYTFMSSTSMCPTEGVSEMRIVNMNTTHRMHSLKNKRSKIKILLLQKWKYFWCVEAYFLEAIIYIQTSKYKFYRFFKTNNFLTVLVFCPFTLFRVKVLSVCLCVCYCFFIGSF